MPPSRTRGGAVALVFAVASMWGCSSGDDSSDTPVPVVDQIDDALTAVTEHYESQGSTDDLRLFEVSANLVDVRVVVAEDWADNTGNAVSYAYRDGELSEPERLGPGQGSAFTPDAVQIDEAHVFDGVRDDLPEGLITDFAATGGLDDSIIYDTTVRSDKGGQLRVRVDGEGRVLEVMAE